MNTPLTALCDNCGNYKTDCHCELVKIDSLRQQLTAAQAEIAALRGVVIHAGKLLAAVDTHLEAIITDSEGNAYIEKPFSLCEIAASQGLTQGCAEVLREYDHFIKQSRDAIAAELKAIKAALARSEGGK